MLRKVRCSLLVLTVAAPVALAVGQGCSDEAPVEDLCTWLGDSSNCMALFESDVGLRCGYAPVEASPPSDAHTGVFMAREPLDLCVLADPGGQVIFDPPLDVKAFPPTSFTFKLIDPSANPCGSGSYAGNENFSITINAVDADDAGFTNDAGWAPPTDDIIGGTYTSTRGEGRDTFDVSCPGGQETHHFNRLTLDKCTELGEYLPRAIVDANPGTPPLALGEAGSPGWVRLRIVYPPDNPAAGGDPRVVEYFNCLVPAPPHMCEDGVRNGTETDLDCGGDCPGCGELMGCYDTDDCADGLTCTAQQGVRVCQ